jgi:transposase
MMLFMKELVAHLEYEDKQWRKSTVIVWDGAGYHTSKEIIKLIEELRVPVMRLGPYSYLMQSAELLFAALKRVKLIEEDQPLGKK